MASTKYQDNRGRTVMHVAAEQVCVHVRVCVFYYCNDTGVCKASKYYKKCSANQCSRF